MSEKKHMVFLFVIYILKRSSFWHNLFFFVQKLMVKCLTMNRQLTRHNLSNSNSGINMKSTFEAILLKPIG